MTFDCDLNVGVRTRAGIIIFFIRVFAGFFRICNTIIQAKKKNKRARRS